MRYSFCAVVGLLMFSNQLASAAEKPNVLFIAVDDLNDWISCLGGHPNCQTPNIDRLAAKGVLFTRSYCTAPACNPSRVSLMTGLRPSTSGIYINPQPWREVLRTTLTLPEYFRKNGYHAAGAGKIFHGRYKDPEAWDDYAPKSPTAKPSKAVQKDPHSRAGGIVWGVLDAEDSEMADHQTVSYAIDYLQKDHDKPFFLACGIFRPHMPWQVPRRYYDMYPLDQIVLPNVPDDDLQDIPKAGIDMAKPKGDHAKIRKTDNWKYAVQGYLASIAFADFQVGRLLAALESSRHADHTIVMLWGDHGWHLGEKHHWRKFSLWEEATRAPLMVYAPGLTPANAKCNRTVDFVNIYPTLCELCGLDVPPHCDGVSLVSLLKNPNAEWKRPAITSHGFRNHAIRTQRWRYIRYADGSEELYDHEQDPMEWTNLAGQPDSRSTIANLSKFLPTKNAKSAPLDRSIVKQRKAR
jgi:arylsulfatase A-like enzyme